MREHIHFTYDDDFLPNLGIPNYIRCLRGASWKYAVYYDPLTAACHYEMYDLEADPLELHNLARDPGSLSQRRRLHQALTAEMLRAGTMPDAMEWPAAPEGDQDPGKAD